MTVITQPTQRLHTDRSQNGNVSVQVANVVELVCAKMLRFMQNVSVFTTHTEHTGKLTHTN